ncbi:MAG: SDR family oxidoreductase [Lachnospiraceae bacterium]|jgi:short-subunit dehydrogenase|nr:SDR family oxidoreductase [Lachnospiraceae bacterium]
MKTALITGATSGIGMEFARAYAAKGYRLLVTGRREDRLKQLQEELDVPVEYYIFDLGKKKECFALLDALKDETIDVFINNAGFGLAGSFVETDLEREISMVKLNDIAMHILFKGILQRMVALDSGSILNVASSAGLLPGGPYMATYYATKAYVTSLTRAVAVELREKKSHVRVHALCPGPVDTEFNANADVVFALKGISAKDCVKAAIKGMDKRGVIIVPNFTMKLAVIAGYILPRSLAVKITGHQQKKKLAS